MKYTTQTERTRASHDPRVTEDTLSDGSTVSTKTSASEQISFGNCPTCAGNWRRRWDVYRRTSIPPPTL